VSSKKVNKNRVDAKNKAAANRTAETQNENNEKFDLKTFHYFPKNSA